MHNYLSFQSTGVRDVMDRLSAKGIHSDPEQLLMALDAVIADMDAVLTIPSSKLLGLEERELLAAGGFDLETSPQAAANAIEQGALGYAALLASSLSTFDASQVLGCNASRIRQRLGGRSLYGVRDGHSWRLPRFQFLIIDGQIRGEVPKIGQVLQHLPADAHPVSVYQWFVTPNTELWDDTADQALSPLVWLMRGNELSPMQELATLL